MLYLVATPIGNLGDMTYRAVEVLKSVDLIASEDSRKTSVLLKHYDISKPQTALNNFNERKVVPKLMERLERGENIALVTDAGTPGISDPGYLLAHEALQAGKRGEYCPGNRCWHAGHIRPGLPSGARSAAGWHRGAIDTGSVGSDHGTHPGGSAAAFVHFQRLSA